MKSDEKDHLFTVRKNYSPIRMRSTTSADPDANRARPVSPCKSRDDGFCYGMMIFNDPRQKLHRVKCSIPSGQLAGKRLAYFWHNRKIQDHVMQILEPRPDGTFLLCVTLVSWDAPGSVEETGQIGWRDVALDQATVDKIEAAPNSSWLCGAEYVVFDDSPRARELCYRAARGDQTAEFELNPEADAAV